MCAIEIRPVSTVADFAAIESIQEEAWGMTDREIVPGRLMRALQAQGAAVLGAYDSSIAAGNGADPLVGFNFATLATVEELSGRIDRVAAARLKMYSIMMGVRPAYQGQGVGYQLKLAQREFALRIGIRLISWTYDPLEGRNAWLNIARLGAVCNKYLSDYYGPRSGLNAGVPTDRFHTEWWVTGNRVKARVDRNRRPLKLDALVGGGATPATDVVFNDAGWPEPAERPLDGDPNLVLVEIPYDFQALKAADLDLATRWRLTTRAIFERLIAARYLVTDFVTDEDMDGRRRSYYLLTNRDS